MKSRSKNILGISVAVVFCGYLVFDTFIKNAGSAQRGENTSKIVSDARIVPVTTEPLARRLFEERMVLQGTVEAKETALVPARMGGTIEVIHVDEGDRVIAGETVLFETDALSAEKRVEIARRELAVAGFSLEEKEAGRDRVEANLHKATLDYHRFERLLEKKAVTEDAYERAESMYRQDAASARHAASLVALAVEQERLAAAALVIAEKGLEDARVVAPISGRVSKRFMEPGEWGEPMKPVLRIDDLSVVEISAWMPESYFHRVVPGETPMCVRAGDTDLSERPIAYRSPTVHPALRTFEIKGIVESPPDGVVPGAMATIEILLDQREAFGVRRESIVMHNTGPVIFHVSGGVARLQQIKTGLETDGYVEITGHDLPLGAAIVTMGQFLLNDDAPVQFEN